MKKKIVILGSTGSIGRQTLEIVRAFPEKFEILGLASGSNYRLLAEQIAEFSPSFAVMRDRSALQQLEPLVAEKPVSLSWGEAANCALAELPDADLVLVALVGISGLLPTLKAVKAGKTVALANKETLVCGGDLVMKALNRPNQLLPVDSEHSAIFQCLQGEEAQALETVYLTSSGGPFRAFTADQLKIVTAKDALAHPTWNMGPKVTIDSAGLMNKGFEVIEAYHLFNCPLEKIQVVVHPQSVIHSMVEMQDGSVLAQLAPPDMRHPIQYALDFPHREKKIWSRLDLFKLKELTFEEPRFKDFPCLELAYAAQREGGSAPVVLNAADEIAVEAFLQDKIRFLDIPRLIEKTLNAHPRVKAPGLEEILELDSRAREYAKSLIK